ncbi:hypothetical protein K469DRAFT_277114 [Zopfia rhizophila CBS 207.26]|uniref:C2H2-type domain-containing protein n=1 Tax=Zopfia rhizophila CBS 207.26 TaxID=1314779 RepID=A0A6A6DQL4_9PEZI|nr:hypothetical protein K469DRAFT_277114 [Zopfia rhizophila CBS 207.26]
MGHLLVVVLVTLLLKHAAATSPALDTTLPTAAMPTYYPDPEGMLTGICELCGYSIDFCAHALTNLPRRPTFTPETFLEHPEWPGDEFVQLPVLPPEPEPELQLTPDYTYGQPLRDDYVRQLNENATTIQPSTIQIHIEGTYTPGDRISPPPSRRAQRREAPRPGGYPCQYNGCRKAFDRRCDLNRHQKTHQSRSERPHKCSICNEGFLYPKDRSRHERTHGQSPTPSVVLFCEVPGCNNVDGFSRKDNLLRHQRKQHPNYVSLSN